MCGYIWMIWAILKRNLTTNLTCLSQNFIWTLISKTIDFLDQKVSVQSFSFPRNFIERENSFEKKKKISLSLSMVKF